MMDTNRQSPGRQNQSESLFSNFMAEAESVANMGYNPSGSETQYSASLMGAMMSSSDLYLSHSIHTHDGDDEKTLATGTLKSIPTSINNQVLLENDHDGSGQNSHRHADTNDSNRPIKSYEDHPGGHNNEIKIAIQTHHHIPTTTNITNHEDNIISWTSPRDPDNPRNFTPLRKALITLTTSALLLGTVSVGSSILLLQPSSIITHAFNTSINPPNPILTTTLPSSLWLIGLAMGALFLFPPPLHISAKYGHRMPLFISLIGLCLLQIPSALTGNLPVFLVSRFLAGMFGSGVVVTVPRVYRELYEPAVASPVAVAIYGMCVLLGAALGPVVGCALLSGTSDGGEGWRWASWMVMIIGVVLLLVGTCTVPETCSEVLLGRRARKLRVETGNWALHAKCEEVLPLGVGGLLKEGVIKPMGMVFTEPVLFLVTVHVTLVYGVLYLVLVVVPWGFHQRGFVGMEASLPLIGVSLGIITGFGLFCLVTMTWYKKRARYHRDGLCSPEDRLPTILLGSVTLPLSLLWFGWSADVHWASQAVAGYFIGVGLTLVFVSGEAYVFDAYETHAHSAMSGHMVIRSLAGSSFLLWAMPLFRALGVPWASSLMALVCAIMVFVPVVLIIYGPEMRSRSKFSFVL